MSFNIENNVPKCFCCDQYLDFDIEYIIKKCMRTNVFIIKCVKCKKENVISIKNINLQLENVELKT